MRPAIIVARSATASAILLVGLTAGALAESLPTHETTSKANVDSTSRGLALGFTVDMLPIALSAAAGEVGASGQVWGGLGHWRARLVGARIAFPNWLAGKDGFEDQRTNVGAALVDYVFGDHFDKWWIGSGIEFWRSTIAHENVKDYRATWNTTVWTLGGGYLFPIFRSLRTTGSYTTVYLEPWGAGHIAITDGRPSIGGMTYRPQRLNGEVSLKVGVFFDL